MNPIPAPTTPAHRHHFVLLSALCAVLTVTGGYASAAEKEDEDKSKAKSEQEATEAKIQSKARPFGLDIVEKVMVAGSDAAAANFQNNVLPSVNLLLNQKLGETVKIDDSSFLLDPSKLKLKTDSDVRVYFVGEGAAYQNSLGFNTEGGGVNSGDPLLIFPNASSPVSTYDPLKTTARTANAPLLPGDFVNLGKFEGGTLLDFFLIADGANGGKNVYSTDSSINRDGINHVVSFAYATKDSPYLIIGFEDLYGGGDRDFNDLLFAVDIGMANIAALTGTPEPALMLTMVGFLGGVVWLKRRNSGLPNSTPTAVA